MMNAMPGLHPFQTDDARLQPIFDKVMAGKRLDATDAVNLYRTGDILAVGWLANLRPRTDARRHRRISMSTGTSIQPTSV